MERGLAETVDPAADEEMEEESGEGQGVYCVTCGHEVATRRAVKHMENCFNKVTGREEELYSRLKEILKM